MFFMVVLVMGRFFMTVLIMVVMFMRMRFMIMLLFFLSSLFLVDQRISMYIMHIITPINMLIYFF